MRTVKISCITFLFSISCIIYSCKKFVEVAPPTDKIVGAEMYNTDAGAASVLTGILSDMTRDGFAKGTNSIGVLTGLYTDELSLDPANTGVLASLYTDNLSNIEPGIWSEMYSYIFRTNSAIEGISASKSLSLEVKQHLLGEAKVLRAFFYFFLVNLYGDVPLVTSTNLEENVKLPRTDKNIVYEHMIADLTDAIDNLNTNYLSADIKTPTTEKVRPNKNVAKSLLSRIYLYTSQWKDAEKISNEVIEATSDYNLESDLSKVFLKTSSETIWALQPTTAYGLGKTDAGIYILTQGLTYNQPVFLNKALVNTFDDIDKRKQLWIQSYLNQSDTISFSSKYKDISDGNALTEYIVLFRLPEQYLIRAEARAYEGRLTGANSAVEDLNLIRRRVGLEPTTATTLQDILDEILKEKKFEFFTEWGHRFFDLKRTGKLNEVMTNIAPFKGATWEPYKALFPLPIQDIPRSPALKGHQNPGYPEI